MRLSDEQENRRKLGDRLSHERHQFQRDKEATQEVSRGQSSAGPCSVSAQAADFLGDAEHPSTPTACPEGLRLQAWDPPAWPLAWGLLQAGSLNKGSALPCLPLCAVRGGSPAGLGDRLGLQPPPSTLFIPSANINTAVCQGLCSR